MQQQSKDSSDDTKGIIHKREKNNKLGVIKIKIFVLQKTVVKIKNQVIDWENIPDEKLVSGICK